MTEQNEDTEGTLADEVRATVHNLAARMTDPLILATSLAWVGFNWKFLFLLLHERANHIPPASIIGEATATLDWCHSLAFPLVAGAFYSLAYPYIGGRIKVHRTKVLAQARKNAAIEEDRAVNELRLKRHKGQLLTREEWLAGPEIAELKSARNELRDAIEDVISDLAPQQKPKPPQDARCLPMPQGLVETGFARSEGKGGLFAIRDPVADADSLVYVFRVFARSQLALAAAFGVPFPIPKSESGTATHYLTPTGPVFSVKTPPHAIAHVKVIANTSWGILTRGLPV